MFISFPVYGMATFSDLKLNPVDQRQTNVMGRTGLFPTLVGINVITVITACTVGQLIELC